MSDGPPTTLHEEPAAPRRPRQPRRAGDAARRMLVTTIAITAVVALGVLAWTTFRGDDDDGTTTDVGWDEIAIVDRASGDVIRYGDDGQQLGRSAGPGRVVDTHRHGDHLALVRSSEIVVTDAGDDPVVVPIPRGAVVVPIETADTMHLRVGDPTGGNLLIVDVEGGTVIDVGAAAAPTVPKVFVETVQIGAEGTRFAVADANNFQTIVVGDEIDGAAFLADQPLAVGDDLIATTQVVNLQADISLVGLDRRVEAVVPTELPRGGVMVDDELVMVSVDGGVFRIGDGDREAARLGAISIPAGSTVAWVLPTYLGERLVVGGAGFVAVVDLEGSTLFTTSFAAGGDPLRPRPGWRCLPVAADTGHSLVSLDDGGQLADLTGLTITSISADGCTVVGERAGVFELVDAERAVRLGALRDVVVAPDGDAVVWTTPTGRTELVTVSDDGALADPVELLGAPTSRTVTFLRR